MMPEHIYLRSQTYKSRQRAVRAFHKWICKKGYYGELIFARPSPHHHPRWMRLPPAGRSWVSGVPPFDPKRDRQDSPREEWNIEFYQHYEGQRSRKIRESELELFRQLGLSEIEHGRLIDHAARTLKYLRPATTLMRNSCLTFDDVPDEVFELQTLITAAKRLIRTKRVNST